jgi:carbonic anhydrase
LKEGNARFVRGESAHPALTQGWRQHLLATGQHPFATVLGCSDSRVPPELVFDQGLGDLFIVRVAGNVVATEVLGSLGYALDHLGTPLFVVLGHEGCGAVQAALEAKRRRVVGHPKLAELLDAILPALDGLDPHRSPQRQMQDAVEANVRWAVRQLARTPSARVALAQSRIRLVGAVYELATGRVRFLRGGSR